MYANKRCSPGCRSSDWSREFDEKKMFGDEEEEDDLIVSNPFPEEEEKEWDQEKEMAKYKTKDPIYAHYCKQKELGKTVAVTYEGYLAAGMHTYSQAGVKFTKEGREEYWWDVMPYYSLVSGNFFPEKARSHG